MGQADSMKTIIPHGWEHCVLPDFANIVMGQSPPSSTYNRSGNGLPFFQGKAEFGDLYPKVKMYCSQPNKIAKQYATLLSVRAPVGPTNLAPQDCCIGRGLAAIHPCGGITPKFLLYLFRSIEPEISGKGTGSTFNAITKNFVEGLNFGLPPLSEQHRIVAKIDELFSELDKGVDSLKAAKAKLDVYRQALLKHAFEGKLTAKWREEYKGKIETPEQLLVRIKHDREARYDQQRQRWKAAVKVCEESGKHGRKPAISKPGKSQVLSGNMAPNTAGRFPIGWIQPNLLDVVELNPRMDEITLSSNTMVSFVPMSKLEAVTGNIDASELRHLEKVRRGYTPFREGDVLFAKITPCMENGKMAVVPSLKNGLGFGSTEFHVLRPNDVVLSQYIYLFVSSGTFRRDAAHNMTGAVGQRRVPASYLASQKIPLPSVEEQRRIVAIIKELFSSIEQKEREIDTTLDQAEMLRHSILGKAFSGQLVSQDTNDEPASILLERIKEEKAAQSQNTKRIKRRREKVPV